MAYMDDRVWCHAKFTDLSASAFRAYWNGVAYSSGMNRRGVLTRAQQTLVRSTSKVRAELIAAGLWDELEHGAVYIHDWHEYNDKRDERKAKDRERKRRVRGQSAGMSADSPQERPLENGGDVRALKGEGVKLTTSPTSDVDVKPPFAEELAVAKVLEAVGDVDDDALTKIRGYVRRLPEGSVAKVVESVRHQRPRNRVGYVLAALSSELKQVAA